MCTTMPERQNMTIKLAVVHFLSVNFIIILRESVALLLLVPLQPRSWPLPDPTHYPFMSSMGHEQFYIRSPITVAMIRSTNPDYLSVVHLPSSTSRIPPPGCCR